VGACGVLFGGMRACLACLGSGCGLEQADAGGGVYLCAGLWVGACMHAGSDAGMLAGRA
jgi:hypothetical protein